MVSDIKQAFLQISMDENDRDHLRMIWFDNVLSTNPTTKLLQFTSLVFGLTSSPFAVNGTVKRQSLFRITKRKTLLLNYSEIYMSMMLQPALIVLMKVSSFMKFLNRVCLRVILHYRNGLQVIKSYNLL